MEARADVFVCVSVLGVRASERVCHAIVFPQRGGAVTWETERAEG